MSRIHRIFVGLPLPILLAFASPAGAVESVLGVSINGVAADSTFDQDRKEIEAVLGGIEKETSGLSEYVRSLDALNGVLTQLRDHEKIGEGNFAGVPQVFRGINGLALLQSYWTRLNDGNTRLKGKLIDYVFDGTTAWVTVAMKIDWFRDVTVNGRQIRQVKERDFLHWFIEFRPTIPALVRDGNEALDTQPFSAAPALPLHATDPEDQRSVWKRGLTHKLMATGNQITIKAVYHKTNNDGSFKLLHPSHPFYDTDKPACIDFMFAGEPPQTHLPDQIGWCFGMCDMDNNRFVVNSNGD